MYEDFVLKKNVVKIAHAKTAKNRKISDKSWRLYERDIVVCCFKANQELYYTVDWNNSYACIPLFEAQKLDSG